MKSIVISSLAAVSLSTASHAESITLYSDPTTGQVFTQEGADRVKMGEFADAKSVEKSDCKVTVINPASPNFLLGRETGPNMKFSATDNPDMWLKLGVRLQGTFEHYDEQYNDGTPDAEGWDFYMRRVRFEVSAGFSKNVSFTMDIRDDKVNYEDKGEQSFSVGDAYLQIKKPLDTSLVNFKIYRGKIDVSRTETVKSAYVIDYDRPYVADEAAQYISHNRRGDNIAMYGDWKKKIHYQIATGDGIYSGKLEDARGDKFDGDMTQTSLFYGGKVFISPFDGWEETKRTETYFAQGKHFEIGAAYWISPDIKYDDGIVAQTIEHKLLNLEMSAHYEGAFVQAEYFEFDGVVKEWGNPETGKSSGWYATGEYVIEDLAYLAPFVRYENWNKWEDESGYDLESKIAGVNWYLRGNSTKVGMYLQEDTYGKEIGDYSETLFRVTSQWFF